MTDPKTARPFLEAEVEGLQAFDFLAVAPGGNPFHLVEVTRGADGALEVRVPGRPRLLPELEVEIRRRLRDHGFASQDPADRTKPWVRRVDDAAAGVDLLRTVLGEVFGEKPDAALDIAHGSHRAEVEALEKLAATRAQIEKTLMEMAGAPVERDDDGDYILPVDDVHVMVAPRATPDGTVVVRVFAIANVGVNVTPELGLFLARLNFGLMFGRFALDIEHRSIWFDESLLGDPLNEKQLRFAVKIVGATADEWDDRLKQMFGGATYQDVLKNRASGSAPPTKPGHGGYL
jgi:hypothetical protein